MTATTLRFDHTPTPSEIADALMARGDVRGAITFMALISIMDERGERDGSIRVTPDEVLDRVQELGMWDAWEATP